MSHRHFLLCDISTFPKDEATKFIVATSRGIVATIQFPPNSQKKIPDSLFHESGIC
jgi:hypothetical protein